MYSIGIDIGGTSARVALFDSEFNLISKDITSTINKEFDLMINEIISMIKKVDPENKSEIIGVSSAGPIDNVRGMILDAPNLPEWQYKPFTKLIKEKTGRSIFFTNDANAAAIAQSIEDKNEMIVFITVSTGIGGGIVYKGELIEGKKVYAGEFGAMIISDDDRKHPSLYAGTLESLCSGTALSKQATNKYGMETSAKELLDKYSLGDKIAEEIIDLWVEHFSRAIANIILSIEPDIFYLGGSVILNNEFLIEKVLEKTKGKLYKGLQDRIEIKVAKYGEDAGLVGAANNAVIKYRSEVKND